MTLWAVVLVVVGLGMTIYAGNARMAAKLDERPERRGAGAMSRFFFRLGLWMLLLGVLLFAISVIVHTVMFVLTIVVVGAIVVGVISLLGRLHRPGVD